VFDWTVDVSDLLVLTGALVALLRSMRLQTLRDQKIDLLLFGTPEHPGLLGDVNHLKQEMYDPIGAVARLRRSLTRIRVALAAKGIQAEE